MRATHECGVVGPWSACADFTVDDQAPTWPPGLAATNHLPGQWSAVPIVTTTWPAAADGCGVAYRVLWDHAPGTVPSPAIPTVPDTVHTTPPLPDGADHWVHVQAVDDAGNEAPPRHLGPFMIDSRAPQAVLRAPNGGETLAHNATFTVVWAAGDASSGVALTRLSWSSDDGMSWYLAAEIAGPGVTSYDWTVPYASTDVARMRVEVFDGAGNPAADISDGPFTIATTSAAPEAAPRPLAIESIHPNPFNARTGIEFGLPEATRVRLAVYDLAGRRVRALLDGIELGPGAHGADWDGLDESGRAVGSGVYVLTLDADGRRLTRRLTLLR